MNANLLRVRALVIVLALAVLPAALAAQASATATDPAAKLWSGSVTAGVSYLSSAYVQFGYSLAATAERAHGPYTLDLSASRTYGRVTVSGQKKVAANNYKAAALLERSLGETFSYDLRVSATRDMVQGVRGRLEELAGVGVRIAPSPRLHFRLVPGLALLEENKQDVEGGTSPGAGIYETFVWYPTKTWSIVEYGALRRGFHRRNDAHYMTNTKVSARIYKSLGFTLQYELDHASLLAADATADQHTLTGGFSITF